jgi:hypothetical protein|tara:strand:- start:58 stop:183 length:126 start_codon:yes stop_codon:yes gene_type:complete
MQTVNVNGKNIEVSDKEAKYLLRTGRAKAPAAAKKKASKKK